MQGIIANYTGVTCYRYNKYKHPASHVLNLFLFQIDNMAENYCLLDYAQSQVISQAQFNSKVGQNQNSLSQQRIVESSQ